LYYGSVLKTAKLKAIKFPKFWVLWSDNIQIYKIDGTAH